MSKALKKINNKVRQKIFSKVLKGRVPKSLLPNKLNLLIQMRRGSSTAFNTIIMMAYSIENNLNYTFDENLEIQTDNKILCPLDIRALNRTKHKLYNTHFSEVLLNYKFNKAYVRIRNPYNQFLSYYSYLTIFQSPAILSASQAIKYLSKFASNLNNLNNKNIRLVKSEDFFECKYSQLVDFFNHIDIPVSSSSIKKAITEYEEIERKRKSLSNFSARKSYSKFQLPIENTIREELKEALNGTVFSDFYCLKELKF